MLETIIAVLTNRVSSLDRFAFSAPSHETNANDKAPRNRNTLLTTMETCGPPVCCHLSIMEVIGRAELRRIIKLQKAGPQQS
jgi:hypothetical protein